MQPTEPVLRKIYLINSMRYGKNMKRNSTRFLALLLIMLLIFLTAGCDSAAPAGVDVDVQENVDSDLILTPQAAPDGNPYRIAVVDLDPYLPSSQFFYSYIMRLWELGWIQADQIPIDESLSIDEMVAVLSDMDLGGLITFEKELCFYLLYDELDLIEDRLLDAAASEDGLDLILAMGTDPGLFVKELGLGVPMLDPMATDPVASGIIDSVTDSGDPNIWALVEPNTMGRQLTYYHQMFGFETMGMVVEPETQEIAGVPIYEKIAEELGVTVVKKLIPTDEMPEDYDAYYQELGRKYRELAYEEKVDVFLLTYHTSQYPEELETLFQPFLDAKIPVLVSDGDAFVEYGALLCVSSYDYSSYGRFTADITSTVFHGRSPDSLPNEFVSSPRIVLNAKTAEAIDYPLDFRLLQSSDVIYNYEEEGGM